MIEEDEMSDTPTIRCKKCANTFQPDMKTRGPWVCPSCQTENPNLKRHYRTIAHLFILGLIFAVIVAADGFSRAGLNLGVFLSTGSAVLFLVTVVFIYKSKAPWTDTPVKALIWTVFGLSFVFMIVLPLVLSGKLDIPAIIVYAVLFPYLFWLNSQSHKCTPFEGPAPEPANEES